MQKRLQTIIASRGYTSRRKAEELIKQGKVYVDGEKVDTLGTKVDENAEIIIDGEILNHERLEYYLLNKPRGVVSTTSDEKGRKTIVDLIETNARIYPVGRLDYDTTGLILLTNDGELTNILTHPSTKVLKTYLAKINKVLTMEEYHKIKDNMVIDGKKVNVKRLKIKKKDEKKNTCFVVITIHEGRNHIVKRIFESLHIDVLKLTRTNFAFLDLGNLKSYEYRTLTNEEVAKLKSYKRKK